MPIYVVKNEANDYDFAHYLEKQVNSGNGVNT